MTGAPFEAKLGPVTPFFPTRPSSWRKWPGLLLLAFALGTSATRSARATDPLSAYEYSEWLAHSLALVEREYVTPPDFEKLRDGALRGMVEGLDPHSAFLSREDLEIFEGDTSGRFGGVGLEVDFRGEEVVVIAHVPGSPAARAGILPGDRIVAIAGLRASELKPHDIVRRMRGPIGTRAHLTITEKKTGQTRDVALVREQIQVKSVDSAPLEGGGLYVHIKSFQDGTHDEFLGALAAHGNPGSGLLLDLRNNPGGLVREAVAIADEFLSGGVVFSLRARGATLREVRASSGGAASRGVVVVLVNEFSASAAELLAGALQDQKRAVVVGKTSFGKGSVQTLLPLPGRAALKLTTALYHTPSGETLQARGIVPDVVVAAEMDPKRAVPVVREEDIKGRIGPTHPSTTEGAVDLVPGTDEELHLGVAREIPRDPRGGRDAALAVAYEVLLGDRAPRATERPLSAPHSDDERPAPRE